MAYIKNEWVDQNVERPRTYQLNENVDGSVTLIDDFGQVTELGTPVNADNMNHIEDGVAGIAIRLFNMTEIFALNEWVKDGEKLYVSLQDQNQGHATSETEWWKELSLGGGGLEIGDIAYTRFAVNEVENKRKILNGQSISLIQLKVFKRKLDELKASNPEQFVTNDQWETEALLNPDGVCDKFVYDGGNTVRLPKYPNYVETIPKNMSVKGNGKALGLTDGNMDYGASIVYNTTSHTDYSITLYSDDLDGTVGKQAKWSGAQPTLQQTAGITTDPTKSGMVADTTGLTKLKVTYFIQVATGAEEEDKVINQYQLNNPYSLLDCKYSDHRIANISWLLSQGQFNSGATYASAYDLLLQEQGTPTIEGLSVKTVDEVYTDYDFVINTTDKTFRLPIKTKLASGSAIKGNGITLGITDGQKFAGLSRSAANTKQVMVYDGAYNKPVGTETGHDVSLGTYVGYGITEDSSKSGIVTDDKDLYLYYYVGETVENANLIDVSNLSANKADTNLGNLTTKLADSFLSKLAPDRSKGVIYLDPAPAEGTIDTTEKTVIMPAEGYLTICLFGFNKQLAYLYINDKQIGDVTSVGTSYVNSLTGEYRVSKGDVVRYKAGYDSNNNSYSGYQQVVFNPLKGAN